MGNFESKIYELMHLIQQAIHDSNILLEAKARTELLQILNDQETFWLQRSRV